MSGAGPSNSEDVSDVVTGKRRRQHIDYKVAMPDGTTMCLCLSLTNANESHIATYQQLLYHRESLR